MNVRVCPDKRDRIHPANPPTHFLNCSFMGQMQVNTY